MNLDEYPKKYALINRKARPLVEISPGLYVEPQHIKKQEDFALQYVADSEYDVYYHRFKSYVEANGLRRANLYYKKSFNYEKFLEQLKKEHPELCI